MTCREKLKIEYPSYVDEWCEGGCWGCPDDLGYLEKPEGCTHANGDCRACWDREIPGTEPTETSTYPVKKATDDYIDPIYITIHTNCIDDPAEAIAEVFKYACTVKDRMVNISIQ